MQPNAIISPSFYPSKLYRACSNLEPYRVPFRDSCSLSPQNRLHSVNFHIAEAARWVPVSSLTVFLIPSREKGAGAFWPQGLDQLLLRLIRLQHDRFCWQV